jgi:hypothetical protein
MKVDEDISRAAERLDRAAERIEIGLATVIALLVAMAAWGTFLCFLLARISSGSNGAD